MNSFSEQYPHSGTDPWPSCNPPSRHGLPVGIVARTVDYNNSVASSFALPSKIYNPFSNFDTSLSLKSFLSDYDKQKEQTLQRQKEQEQEWLKQEQTQSPFYQFSCYSLPPDEVDCDDDDQNLNLSNCTNPTITKGMKFGGLALIKFDPLVDPLPGSCIQCHKMGHSLSDCRNPRASSWCSNCGRWDVNIKYCPRCSARFKIWSARPKFRCESMEENLDHHYLEPNNKSTVEDNSFVYAICRNYVQIRVKNLDIQFMDFDTDLDCPAGCCFNCHGEDHPEHRCPFVRLRLSCNNCGRRNVKQRDCPRCKSQEQGTKWQNFELKLRYFREVQTLEFNPNVDPPNDRCWQCLDPDHDYEHCQAKEKQQKLCKNCGRWNVEVDKCRRCSETFLKILEYEKLETPHTQVPPPIFYPFEVTINYSYKEVVIEMLDEFRRKLDKLLFGLKSIGFWPGLDAPHDTCLRCHEPGHKWVDCEKQPGPDKWCANCGRYGADIECCARCGQAFRWFWKKNDYDYASKIINAVSTEKAIVAPLVKLESADYRYFSNIEEINFDLKIDRSPGACFQCHEYGHLLEDCPNDRANWCLNCGRWNVGSTENCQRCYLACANFKKQITADAEKAIVYYVFESDQNLLSQNLDPSVKDMIIEILMGFKRFLKITLYGEKPLKFYGRLDAPKNSCFRCHQNGHYWKKCSALPGQNDWCVNCGRWQVRLQNCPRCGETWGKFWAKQKTARHAKIIEAFYFRPDRYFVVAETEPKIYCDIYRIMGEESEVWYYPAQNKLLKSLSYEPAKQFLNHVMTTYCGHEPIVGDKSNWCLGCGRDDFRLIDCPSCGSEFENWWNENEPNLQRKISEDLQDIVYFYNDFKIELPDLIFQLVCCLLGVITEFFIPSDLPNLEAMAKEVLKQRAYVRFFDELNIVNFDPQIDPQIDACFQCHELGHIYEDCLEIRDNWCVNCGRWDVLIDQCPRCSRTYLEIQTKVDSQIKIPRLSDTPFLPEFAKLFSDCDKQNLNDVIFQYNKFKRCLLFVPKPVAEVCYKCHAADHNWQTCFKPTNRVFCLACGKWDISTSECQICGDLFTQFWKEEGHNCNLREVLQQFLGVKNYFPMQFRFLKVNKEIEFLPELDVPAGACFRCHNFGHDTDECSDPNERFCINCGRWKTDIENCTTCWQTYQDYKQFELERYLKESLNLPIPKIPDDSEYQKIVKLKDCKIVHQVISDFKQEIHRCYITPFDVQHDPQLDCSENLCLCCHHSGHVWTECPNPWHIMCYNCGRWGTRTGDCPRCGNLFRAYWRRRCYNFSELANLFGVQGEIFELEIDLSSQMQIFRRLPVDIDAVLRNKPKKYRFFDDTLDVKFDSSVDAEPESCYQCHETDHRYENCSEHRENWCINCGRWDVNIWDCHRCHQKYNTLAQQLDTQKLNLTRSDSYKIGTLIQDCQYEDLEVLRVIRRGFSRYWRTDLFRIRLVPFDKKLDVAPICCLRCHNYGHSWDKCPRSSKKSWCLNCGRWNTKVENCPRCGPTFRDYWAERNKVDQRPPPKVQEVKPLQTVQSVRPTNFDQTKLLESCCANCYRKVRCYALGHCWSEDGPLDSMRQPFTCSGCGSFGFYVMNCSHCSITSSMAKCDECSSKYRCFADGHCWADKDKPKTVYTCGRCESSGLYIKNCWRCANRIKSSGSIEAETDTQFIKYQRKRKNFTQSKVIKEAKINPVQSKANAAPSVQVSSSAQVPFRVQTTHVIKRPYLSTWVRQSEQNSANKESKSGSLKNKSNNPQISKSSPKKSRGWYGFSSDNVSDPDVKFT